jgi:hypothetical protein
VLDGANYVVEVAHQLDAAHVLASEAWLVLPAWQVAATGCSSPAPRSTARPIRIVFGASAGQLADGDGDGDFIREYDDQVPVARWHDGQPMLPPAALAPGAVGSRGEAGPDEPEEPDERIYKIGLMAKSSGWTAERRARQARLIHQWQPWQNSTGPRTAEGKAVSSRNAYKPASIRHALEIVAADVRAAARRARKLLEPENGSRKPARCAG